MANYDTSVRVNTKVDNSDLNKLQKDFDKLEAKLNSLYAKGEKLEALGVDKQSRQWKTLRYDVAQTEIALEDVKDRIKEVNATAPTKGFERLEKSSKKCFKEIQTGTKKSNGLLSTLGSRLKGIALSLLVFNWITKGFNAMVQAMKEGFQNLAQYSKEYNDAMSSLKSSTSQLKNSLAAAFEPIMTTIIPYLIQFVNCLNSAAETMAQFFAVLSGKNSYTRAKKQNIDYAKSLDAVSKSANKALASFDELNVLSDKNGNKDNGALVGADAFEEVEIDSNRLQSLKQAVKKAKELFAPLVNLFTDLKNGNWFGAGANASNFVSGLFNWISSGIEAVPWHNVGLAIGEFLNGIKWTDVLLSVGNFFETLFDSAIDLWKGAFDAAPIETTILTTLGLLKFTGLGKVFGTKLKTAMITAISTAWTSLGGLSGILTADLATIFGAGTIAEIGLTIGIGIIGGIAAAIAGFNFGKWLGEKLFPEDAEWYKNFTWFGEEGFFDTLFNTDGDILLDALGDMFSDIGKSILNNIFNWDTTAELWDGATYFFEKISEDFKKGDWGAIGMDILSGILGGILAALSYITEPFTDLFSWIWEGICDVFGIHSPAEEMKPLGEYILLGIVEGFRSMFGEFGKAISGFWEKQVKPWFTKKKWTDLLSNIKNAFSSAFTGAVNIAIGIINGLLSALETMINEAVKGLANMAKIANVIPGVNIQFETPQIAIPKIPMLADGAVIQGGKPFAAILGDQPVGQTNIETPLSTMVDAFKIAMAENGSMGEYTFVAQLDGRTIFKETVKQNQMYQKATGRSAFGY